MADLSLYLMQIENRLKAKTIHELRQIARAVGVLRPADGQKGRILEDTVAIAAGRLDPCEPSKKGAPPKSNEYDRVLVADIMKCRELYLSKDGEDHSEDYKLSVGSGKEDYLEATTVYGILDKSGKDWLVRVNGGGYADVHLNNSFVSVYNLRVGDFLCCEAKRAETDDMAGVVNVLEVNGASPSEMIERKNFSELTPVTSDKRINVSAAGIGGRIIDLFAPVGLGGRVGIFGEACPQKARLLSELAKTLSENADLQVILLKIDSSYEDVVNMQSEKFYTFASYYDSGSEIHVRTARLALEYAKRQAELGINTVLIIDSVNSLAEAFNSYGRHISVQLEVSTLEEIKRYFAAAHCTKESGSITLIASVDDDDEFSGSLSAPLKKLCNTRITFSHNARQSRAYPDLDFNGTYSVNEEILLSEEEAEVSSSLRNCAAEEIIAKLSETETNAELIEKRKG